MSLSPGPKIDRFDLDGHVSVGVFYFDVERFPSDRVSDIWHTELTLAYLSGVLDAISSRTENDQSFIDARRWISQVRSICAIERERFVDDGAKTSVDQSDRAAITGAIAEGAHRAS